MASSISIRKALLSVPVLELTSLKKGLSDECLGAMQARLGDLPYASSSLTVTMCSRDARTSARALLD